MNAENGKVKDINDCKLTLADKWILSKLNKAIREVTVNMEKYDMGIALAKLYDFVWSDFCDWYIELTKPVLYGDDEEKRNSTLSVLVYVLSETLKLLHPFVPFITEEIYQSLPVHTESIMIADFPRYNSKMLYTKPKKQMEEVMTVIKAIRNIKVKVNCAPSKKVPLYIVTANKKCFKDASVYIEKLAGVSGISFIDDKTALTEKTVSGITESAEIYIPLGELVDTEKELARLKAEYNTVEAEIKRANGKLSNKGFLDKAPKQLVDAEKAKLEKYMDILAKLKKEIAELE
jgi:valyl-tRNA synthetase